ncbi:hypothetical protein [Nocardia sp. NPDC004260]
MSQPRKVHLAEVVKEAKPGFACGEEQPDGVFQIRMNNVTRDGRLDTTKKRLVPPDHKGIPGALLREGDVLFNATNSPDLVGKTVRVSNLSEPTVFSNHFLRLRADTSKLDPSYLARWLNSEFQRGTYKAMCRQWVNQATLGREALLGTTIPLLHLSEQRQVAEVLDRVDALREKRRKSIALLDDLAESIFLDMFGDTESNSNRFPIRQFKDLVREPARNGISPSKNGKVLARVLTLSAVTGKRFDPDAVKVSTFIGTPPERQSVCDDDFLVCRGNGNISLVGRGSFPGYNMRDTAFPDTIIASRMDLDSINKYYLEHVWKQSAIRRQIESKARTTNGTFKINQTALESIQIPVAPISEQTRFGCRMKIIELQAESHLLHLAHLDSLFASIQSRAFRGELWQDDLKDL